MTQYFGALFGFSCAVLLTGVVGCELDADVAANETGGTPGNGGSATGGAENGGAATGGAATGGAATGGAENGGAENGGAATGGTGSSTGGAAGGECSAYEDAAGWSIEVVIRNESSQTIYLGQPEVTCTIAPLFEVTDASGALVPPVPDCGNPCGEMMRGGAGGCPLLCLFPQTVTLEPHESTRVVWDGLYGVDVELPEQCTPAGETAPFACDRAEEIHPGTFTFKVEAGMSLECADEFVECDTCTPSESGGCITNAALIAGAKLSADTTVMLDPSYGVGGGRGGGAVAPVEIFFRD
ncbi:MAG: hypothetical protein JW751_12420 [Polyangiaceae bacterium]|nr:hypothetical protein [Polyangiaceae bacterium]